MADRHNYYFGQLVQEDELDEGFAWLEAADWKQNVDTGYRGVTLPWADTAGGASLALVSWAARQNAVPDLNVIVDTGYAYDKLGKRIAVDPPTTALVDCSQDYLGDSTAVTVLGNENWLGIYLKYNKLELDPRTDDNGLTVYFTEEESYELEVRQGGEQPIGTDAKPALDTEALLIAEVYLVFGTVAITNAEIYSLADTAAGLGRCESLVRFDPLDLVETIWGPGTPTWWPFPPNWLLPGRNLNETIWGAEFIVAMILFNAYATRDGLQPWEGDFDPDHTCTRDFGKTTNRWRRVNFQSVNESPDFTNSGPSQQGPDDDWMAAGGLSAGMGYSQTKLIWDGFGMRLQKVLDFWSREHKAGYHFDEDFDYWQGHPGPFKFVVFHTSGAWAFNPAASLYAHDTPAGFIRFTAPNPGDIFRIDRQAYPVLAYDSPHCKWTYVNQLFGPSLLVMIGMEGAAAGAFRGLHWVFDPGGAINPNPPTPNMWCVYDDGVNPPYWFDTGLPPITGSLVEKSVAFEYDDNTATLWARWYAGKSVLVHELDLTLAGYEVAAAADDWDFQYYCFDAAGGAAQILVDRVELFSNVLNR